MESVPYWVRRDFWLSQISQLSERLPPGKLNKLVEAGCIAERARILGAIGRLHIQVNLELRANDKTLKELLAKCKEAKIRVSRRGSRRGGVTTIKCRF